MNHLKRLGLVTLAAVSLVAFAGSASAATFTAPAGTAYFGKFDLTLEGSILMKAGFTEETCTESTIAGEITTNNETEASGPITAVTFNKCSLTVDVLNPKGTLTINKSNTAVSATGVEWTSSALGTSCVYGFGTGTSLGTAKNTEVEGKGRVTLAINGSLSKISGGFACANPATWTANYAVTTPTPSFVD